jgi:CBS domain-containing protein
MISSRAADIMTRDVITVHGSSTVDEAMRLMARHGVSGLPVVDTDGCIQGIITESDVLLKGQRAASPHRTDSEGLFEPKADGVAEAYRRSRAHLVEDAMTRRVLAFSEESYVSDIARAMIEHAVNRVPIVRDCKVVGIVSRRDVVKALAKESHALDGRDPDEVKHGRVFEL